MEELQEIEAKIQEYKDIKNDYVKKHEYEQAAEARGQEVLYIDKFNKLKGIVTIEHILSFENIILPLSNQANETSILEKLEKSDFSKPQIKTLWNTYKLQNKTLDTQSIKEISNTLIKKMLKESKFTKVDTIFVTDKQHLIVEGLQELESIKEITRENIDSEINRYLEKIKEQEFNDKATHILIIFAGLKKIFKESLYPFDNYFVHLENSLSFDIIGLNKENVLKAVALNDKQNLLKSSPKNKILVIDKLLAIEDYMPYFEEIKAHFSDIRQRLPSHKFERINQFQFEFSNIEEFENLIRI